MWIESCYNYSVSDWCFVDHNNMEVEGMGHGLIVILGENFYDIFNVGLKYTCL